MADIGGVLDIELAEQIEIASRGVDLRGDLGIRDRVCDRGGLAGVALDLGEERNHRGSPVGRANAAKSSGSGKARMIPKSMSSTPIGDGHRFPACAKPGIVLSRGSMLRRAKAGRTRSCTE